MAIMDCKIEFIGRSGGGGVVGIQLAFDKSEEALAFNSDLVDLFIKHKQQIDAATCQRNDVESKGGGQS